MSDHETTLRDVADGRTCKVKDIKAACLAGADALHDAKEIAEAVHYYTGENVDVLVQRYRDEHAPTEPTR